MKQKNLTLDAFKKIYAEWQASDTTIREFCRTICFDEDKFYFWKKKLLDSRNASSAGFIPVSMSATVRYPSPPRLQPGHLLRIVALFVKSFIRTVLLYV